MNLKAQNIEDVYELSPLQQGMLFHTLRNPDSSMYFHQVVYTLQGSLDLHAFQQAWRKTVERHATLRTSFHWENLEKPLQVVHRQASVPLEQLDWSDCPLDEREERFQAFLKEDQTRGFVMTQPPLMRLTLLRMAEDLYQFVWSQHHILWDGWSGPLVLKDLLGYYEALRKGED